MKISKLNTYIKAVVEVEAEGYFVERLINLCKINNVKIWDIEYINSGKIQFKVSSKEFKKLKPYVKRSKCKITITNKRGIYFDLFRYRKRKLALVLVGIFLGIFCLLSSFIWNIEVVGNENIASKDILSNIDKIGVKKGKLKLFISKGKVADYLRANIYEAAWIGVDINGTTMTITVKEKIISKEEDKNIVGNIIATKSGIISKIIAENGTAKYKTGSYIDKGSIAILGAIESEFMEPSYVHASGILRGIVDYTFEKEYKYKEKIKENTGVSKRGVGIKINNKKFVLKHLPKDFKCDITSKSKMLNVFSVNISFILETYEEYILKDIVNTKDTLAVRGEQELNQYINEIKTNDSKLVDKNIEIIETNEGIIYKATVKLEENIGKFVETGEK